MENKDDFWAIVELFGHTVLVGKVSKCEIGEFIQVNIPEVPPIPAWTKMLNPKAIYALTPITEAEALQKATALKAMPVSQWDTEELLRNRFSELEQEGKIKMIETDKKDN